MGESTVSMVVSDIAIFVLKRDVKLQITNCKYGGLIKLGLMGVDAGISVDA